MKKRIEGALLLLGIILIAGAFGGADRETLSVLGAVLWSVLGLGLMGAAFAMEECEEK